ncbi:MAG: hypothetical protein L3J24_07515 [Xanthomonadales bacterium]|nr:hypothetical protein [Xanthomonadales bacterium]
MPRLSKKFILLLLAVVSSALLSNVVSAHGNSERDANKRQQWYLSTTVSVYDSINETTYTAVNPVVIGKLAAAKTGKDKYDIKPSTSLANNKAALVFVQQDWGDHSGEYLTDFRSTRYRNDNWLFTVISSINDAEVTLNWSSPNVLTTQFQDNMTTDKEKPTLDSRTLKRLSLIDLSTGEVVKALAIDGRLNNHKFNMAYGEQQREFRWVLGPVRSKHLKTSR